MKFLSYRKNGTEHLGMLADSEHVLAISETSPNLPQSMQSLIERGAKGLAEIQASQAGLKKLDLASLDMLPPLPNPPAIFCAGLNYKVHQQEIGRARPEHPMIFLRLSRSQIAHKQALIKPECSDTLDWEGELVVVIGKGGRHIDRDSAMDHIFGYSIYNDGSIREYQRHTTQFGLGKYFENTGAFGPVVVTADEFGDPYDKELKTFLNDREVQSTSIALMDHQIEDIIAYLSTAVHLRPGDIICTGTPGGVGASRKPPIYMQAGDFIEVMISGIGTLRNPILAERK